MACLAGSLAGGGDAAAAARLFKESRQRIEVLVGAGLGPEEWRCFSDLWLGIW